MKPHFNDGETESEVMYFIQCPKMLHGRDRDLNPNSLASYPWFLTTTPQKVFTFGALDCMCLFF